MIRFIFTLSASIFLNCRQKRVKSESITVTKGNKPVTISTDTSKLSRLIDLTTFKPARVQFEYIFFDDSGQNERLNVPGPSDSYLHALLYFDSTTFNNIKAKSSMAKYPSSDYNRQDFNFDWLSEDVKEELLKTDTGCHGHPDYFFGPGQSGKICLLSNKLLLISYSN